MSVLRVPSRARRPGNHIVVSAPLNPAFGVELIGWNHPAEFQPQTDLILTEILGESDFSQNHRESQMVSVDRSNFLILTQFDPSGP